MIPGKSDLFTIKLNWTLSLEKNHPGKDSEFTFLQNGSRRPARISFRAESEEDAWEWLREKVRL